MFFALWNFVYISFVYKLLELWSVINTLCACLLQIPHLDSGEIISNQWKLRAVCKKVKDYKYVNDSWTHLFSLGETQRRRHSFRLNYLWNFFCSFSSYVTPLGLIKDQLSGSREDEKSEIPSAVSRAHHLHKHHLLEKGLNWNLFTSILTSRRPLELFNNMIRSYYGFKAAFMRWLAPLSLFLFINALW